MKQLIENSCNPTNSEYRGISIKKKKRKPLFTAGIKMAPNELGQEEQDSKFYLNSEKKIEIKTILNTCKTLAQGMQ